MANARIRWEPIHHFSGRNHCPTNQPRSFVTVRRRSWQTVSRSASDGGQVDFPSVASGGRREHAHLVQPDEIAVRILSRVLVAEARRSADSQRTRPYWQRSTAFSYRNASTSASLATRVRGAAAGTVIRFRTSAVTMDGGIEGSSQMPCRALLRSEKPAEQDPNRVFEQHRVPGAARATPHVSTA
jgi:hypothetical protein